MKNIILILVSMFVFSTILAQEQMKFSISGKIEGAERGDTLRFETISPDWRDETPAFDIVVGRSGKVKYRGTHSHSQNYRFWYHPKDTTFKTYSSKFACSVLLTQGEVKIEGDKEHIYYPTLKGGVYDEDLQSIREKQSSIDKERDVIYKKVKSVDRVADAELSRKYQDDFNSFFSQEHIKERMDEVDSLKRWYIDNRSNEYVAYELSVYYAVMMPLDTLESYYNRQTQSVKDSYYGVELNRKIASLKRLAPQMPAPDFALTTISGEVITNKDLLGRYVLIYHYGVCPGSLALDKRLSNWYKKHKDKVEVIGYTSSRESILDKAKDIKPEDKMMGIDMYEALKSMSNHPWRYEVDADFDEANGELETIYDFRGLPFFIFISPEGRILDRGFKTFYNGALKVVDEPVQEGN